MLKSRHSFRNFLVDTVIGDEPEKKVIVDSPILETDSQSKFLCIFNSQNILGKMRVPDSTTIFRVRPDK